MISIVSPFFNEEVIIESAIDKMVSNLERLEVPWELIIVNDGSTDQSLQLAERRASTDPRIIVLSHDVNTGRGYSIKQGIDAAIGDIIITTEIDCSWGDEIVKNLYEKIVAGGSDIVIASTNSPGGGYVNVPSYRIFISRFGNLFLRMFVTSKITMFTGMTRAYRSDIIKSLPISEKGKEFHLDVIIKAISFNHVIEEIPATITWSFGRLSKTTGRKRQSSSKINSLIRSHLIFGLAGQPFRYILVVSMMMFLLANGFLIWAIIKYLAGEVSIYLLSLSLTSYVLAFMMAGIGVITLQQTVLLREIWLMRKEITTEKFGENNYKE